MARTSQHRTIPVDEFLALINANSPSAANPFATLADIGFVVNIVVVLNYAALPAANTVSGDFYFCEQSQGTQWLPGPLGGTYYPSGLYYSNGVSWVGTECPFQATQAQVGTEVGDGGVNTSTFVTPATLKGKSYSMVIRPAGEVIPSHRAVVIISNTLMLFDHLNSAHYGKVIGLSYTSGILTDPIEVVTDDEITLGIPLTDGAIYYAITGGLTTTPPTTGIVQKIGIATSTAKMFVDISVPIQKS